MKMRKLSTAAAAAMITVLYATPSFAQCIPGPGEYSPVVNYSNSVNASQEIRIYAGSSFYSQNGAYQLTFQNDGNLVLYHNGSAIWDTNTQNCTPTPLQSSHARFQSDGNFVVYYNVYGSFPTQEVAIWDTNTQGHPNSRLAVQNDGNVVIYDNSNNRVLWAIRR